MRGNDFMLNMSRFMNDQRLRNDASYGYEVYSVINAANDSRENVMINIMANVYKDVLVRKDSLPKSMFHPGKEIQIDYMDPQYIHPLVSSKLSDLEKLTLREMGKGSLSDLHTYFSGMADAVFESAANQDEFELMSDDEKTAILDGAEDAHRKNEETGKVFSEMDKNLGLVNYRSTMSKEDTHEWFEALSSEMKSSGVEYYHVERNKKGVDYIHGQTDVGNGMQDVYFKASYGNHEWTNSEISNLLRGEEVSIAGRSGQSMSLRLGETEMNGHKYIGPVRTDFDRSKGRNGLDISGIEQSLIDHSTQFDS